MTTILAADALLLSGLLVHEFYSFQQYSTEKRLKNQHVYFIMNH